MEGRLSFACEMNAQDDHEEDDTEQAVAESYVPDDVTADIILAESVALTTMATQLALGALAAAQRRQLSIGDIHG